MFLLIGIIVEMILDVLKKPKEFREVILNGFKVVSAIIMHGGGSGRIHFEAYSFFGGGGRSRTDVQKTYKTRHYERSSFSNLTLRSK